MAKPPVSDAKTKRKNRSAFAKVRKADSQYAIQLRKIANHISMLIEHVDFANPSSVNQLQDSLNRYAYTIEPWAKESARRMLMDVANRDKVAWKRYSMEMGVELRRQIETAPIGEVLRILQDEQVDLIKSLPIEAGMRVQELARGSLYTGERNSNIIQEILRTGEVTINRATLIARTETAKASSLLTQARAVHIGSEGYIWRTVHDYDVRKSHKVMEGKFIKWSDPPEVDPGYRYHAGQFPNCRCFAEPVFPDFG